eukprot:5103576-Amphidinium_carterae.1
MNVTGSCGYDPDSNFLRAREILKVPSATTRFSSSFGWYLKVSVMCASSLRTCPHPTTSTTATIKPQSQSKTTPTHDST